MISQNKYFQQMEEFIEKLRNLSLVTRAKGQTYWKDYANQKEYDNAANHSFSVGLLLYIFSDELPSSLDLMATIRMAIFHDCIEVLCGDTPPQYEGVSRKTNNLFLKEKHSKELEAARKLYSYLPALLNRKYFDLFVEFEERKTLEAKICKAFDDLECMIFVLLRQAYVHPRHLEFTIEYCSRYANSIPNIRDFYNLIKQDMLIKHRPYQNGDKTPIKQLPLSHELQDHRYRNYYEFSMFLMRFKNKFGNYLFRMVLVAFILEENVKNILDFKRVLRMIFVYKFPLQSSNFVDYLPENKKEEIIDLIDSYNRQDCSESYFISLLEKHFEGKMAMRELLLECNINVALTVP